MIRSTICRNTGVDQLVGEVNHKGYWVAGPTWQSRIAKVLKRRKQDMGDIRQLTQYHWTMLLSLRESIAAAVDAGDQENYIRQSALW